MSRRRSNRGGRQDGRSSRRRRRGPRFEGARMILGILNILLAFVLVYRSCLAGVITEGSGIGMPGLLPAVLFLLAGILAVQMRDRTAPLAFLIPAVSCLIADVVCLFQASKQTEWKIWAVAAAVCCAVYLVLFCLHRQRNLAVPAVLLAVTVIATAAVCILAGKGEGTPRDGQNQEADAEGEAPEGSNGTEGAGTGDGTEAGTDAEASGTQANGSNVTAADDGVLNLVTDTFTLAYARHELGTDVNGNSCLYVYYNFMNNSDEAVMIPSVSYTKLLQNGEECSKASVEAQNTEMDNYKNEVAAGATVTACEVYALSDTSQVELQAVEFVPTDAKSDSQILTLE